MKIALCGRFSTDIRHQGGSSEVLLALAKELSKRHVVTLFGRGRPTKNIVDMCHSNRIKFHYIPSDTILNIFIGPMRALTLLKRNFDDFDVIHTHNGSYAFASVFFNRKSKIVTHVHESSIIQGLKGNSIKISIYLFLENFLTKFALKHSHLIITPNEEMKNVITNKIRIRKSIVTIPNGVDNKFFNKESRDSAHIPLRILYVGRLSFQKRVERIIEAIKLLKIPANLMIVGDGDRRRKLQNFAMNLKLNNVSFEGEKSSDELCNYYRRVDIFVISSTNESFGMVILEAMAAGLPIIGSNVNGIRDLVQKVGILVDEPYSEKFTEALTNLANNPQEFKKLSRQSIEKASQYQWVKIVDKLEILYTKLVCSKKRYFENE